MGVLYEYAQNLVRNNIAHTIYYTPSIRVYSHGLVAIPTYSMHNYWY